jgi:uncharacterized membrane protein
MVRAGQTLSQVALHMGVAFGVMYALTGSAAFGGIAALIEPVCNVALLPLHDRLWRNIRLRLEARASRPMKAKRRRPSDSIAAPA